MANEDDEILLSGAFLTKALLPGVERVVSSTVVMAALDTLILFECYESCCCFFLFSFWAMYEYTSTCTRSRRQVRDVG